MNTTYFLHNSAYLNWSSAKFQLKLTILIFLTKFAQKGFSSQKLKKRTSSLILHIQTDLGSKFPLKLTILMFFCCFFWPDLPKKGFSGLKQKMNTTYFLHNFAYSNWSSAKFQLKLTFLIFWTKFAKKGISSWKQEKWTSPWNSAYLN